MKPPTKKPCNQCPMRRISAPGWLGSASSQAFIAAVHTGLAMPCHATVDYEDDEWRARLQPGHPREARQCAGQAIYLTHCSVLPRPGPLAAIRLPADRGRVFATPQEFLDHHRRVRATRTR